MNRAELDILRFFRRYGVTAQQMLFFGAGFADPETPEFNGAMQSLIQRGLVVKERRRGAYSLTARGYHESLRVSEPQPVSSR